ncbi:MAG: hypothetical protein ACLFR6_06330 [Salinarchaeum sp.]
MSEQSDAGVDRDQDEILIYHIFADRGIEAEVLEGFGRVVRVGLDPIKGYGEAVQADATNCPLSPGADLALLHPPCTRWSQMTSIDGNPEDHPDLIEDARELGAQLADHYIIENVPQAPLEDATVLNGRMFGMPIDYERAFETSFHVPEPPRYRRLEQQETSPYLYSSHSRRWWAAAKGYSDVHPKGPIAKNSVPAPYLRYLLRWWLEARGEGQIRDYTEYETAYQEERERNERRRKDNQSLETFAMADGGGQ